MNGQIPLGDVGASKTLQLQECGKFCWEQGGLALIYDSGSCTCYTKITGYADAAGSQKGYIQVNETFTACLTIAEHQAIVKGIGSCMHIYSGRVTKTLL